MSIQRNLKLFPWINFLLDFRMISVVAILFYASVSGSYAKGMFVFTMSLLPAILLLGLFRSP